jgi:hypothetical protein
MSLRQPPTPLKVTLGLRVFALCLNLSRRIQSLHHKSNLNHRTGFSLRVRTRVWKNRQHSNRKQCPSSPVEDRGTVAMCAKLRRPSAMVLDQSALRAWTRNGSAFILNLTTGTIDDSRCMTPSTRLNLCSKLRPLTVNSLNWRG